jgi:hypothetical protein
MPGSGKSTYLRQLAEENPDWFVADDFFKNVSSANRGLRSSPLHQELLEHLRADKTCVIADAEFCKERARLLVPQQLQQELGESFADLTLEWHYFENNFERCVANVLRQHKSTEETKEQIKLLLEISAKYAIAPGHKTLKVWSPEKGL